MTTAFKVSHPISKADELRLLAELAELLGPNSYCGPWLASIIPEIKRDIESDLPPAPTIPKAREVAAEIVREADAKYDTMVKAAKAHADNLRTIAENRNEYTRHCLLRAIETAQRSLVAA